MLETGEICPTCNANMYAEFVDIGVGFQQVTESMCPNYCGYLEWEEEKEQKRQEIKSSVENYLNLLKEN